MNEYSLIKPESHAEYQNNFTISYINLFVKFFNSINNESSLMDLKFIVRPNNNYITTDLIKLLIDYARNQYKETIQTIFKNDLINQRRTFSRNSNISKPKSQIKLHLQTQQTKIQDQSQQYIAQQQQQSNYNITKNHYYQRYKRFIFNADYQQIQQRINCNFILLNQLNCENKHIISKYRDKCLGNKRNINYDYSGLYTNQQMSNIINKLTASLNQQEIQLKQRCTSQQLLKKYKKTIEKQLIKEKLFKRVIQNVNCWLPLRIQERYQKSPYSLVVDLGKQSININKYNSINRKPSIPNFLQQKLKESISKDILPKSSNYRKELIVNFSRKKIQQMLYQDRISIKKEIFLPSVRSESIKSIKKQQQFKTKHKSQTKLIPLIVNAPQKKNIITNITKNYNYNNMIVQLSPIKLINDQSYNFLTRQKYLSTYQ